MMSPPGSFEAWLSPAQGFHPTFKTTSKLNDAALLKECSLNLHFLLPATVFADRYELQNYAPRLQFEYRGPSNLELPVFALKAEEGAPELLVSVDLGGEGDDGPIEVDVPLHLRYGPVSALDSERHEAVEFPYPEAFLACPRTADDERDTSGNVSKLSAYPLVSGLLNSSSIALLPLQSANAFGGEIARLPLGQAAHAPVVEFGTSSVIILTFIYLLAKSCKSFTRLGLSS